MFAGDTAVMTVSWLHFHTFHPVAAGEFFLGGAQFKYHSTMRRKEVLRRIL